MANAIDESVLLNSLGGDEELLVELINAFLAESEGLLERVTDAVARRDAARLERAAHNLKGTVNIFGLPPITEAAQALESMGRERDLQDAVAAAGQVRERTQVMVRQLTGLRERLLHNSARRG
jgi:HPt (histidine-containing phosphotransfer) domain-containing protein